MTTSSHTYRSINVPYRAGKRAIVWGGDSFDARWEDSRRALQSQARAIWKHDHPRRLQQNTCDILFFSTKRHTNSRLAKSHSAITPQECAISSSATVIYRSDCNLRPKRVALQDQQRFLPRPTPPLLRRAVKAVVNRRKAVLHDKRQTRTTHCCRSGSTNCQAHCANRTSGVVAVSIAAMHTACGNGVTLEWPNLSNGVKPPSAPRGDRDAPASRWHMAGSITPDITIRNGSGARHIDVTTVDPLAASPSALRVAC
jgi:hypothetical protein